MLTNLTSLDRERGEGDEERMKERMKQQEIEKELKFLSFCLFKIVIFTSCYPPMQWYRCKPLKWWF